MDLEKFLEKVVKDFAPEIAIDLVACAVQKVHTTKVERRERALAYVIENLTGLMAGANGSDGWFPSVEWCDQMLAFVVTVGPTCRTAEAKTGFERAERRLRWALDHPEKSMRKYNKRPCAGCGELIERGAPHECDSARARARDIAMTRDDTVQ